jgi:NAD(P)H dehydrogenase (quinone)
MLIITGANGAFGREAVEQVLRRVPADRVGVSVRDTARAAPLAARGVRVRHGDFAEPDSLLHAFEGATQLLVVSIDQIGEEAVAQHAGAIDAARSVGAQRVLYTSHMGARADSTFAAAVDHAATEALLRESGVPFTSLRNGFYANTARMLVDQALQTGTLSAPEDGPVSWTAPADLAEAAAVILTQSEPINGQTPPLAITDPIDLTDLAAIASELHDREIARVTVTDDEYRAGLVAHGTPERFADMLIGMFRASRRGDFAAGDPTLQSLIGRSPITIRQALSGEPADGHR